MEVRRLSSANDELPELHKRVKILEETQETHDTTLSQMEVCVYTCVGGRRRVGGVVSQLFSLSLHGKIQLAYETGRGWEWLWTLSLCIMYI